MPSTSNLGRVSEALFAAIKSGDAETLNALLARDPGLANAREDGVSAVLVSLYHRQDAAREALLAAGAQVGPLEGAARGGPGPSRHHAPRGARPPPPPLSP